MKAKIFWKRPYTGEIEKGSNMVLASQGRRVQGAIRRFSNLIVIEHVVQHLVVWKKSPATLRHLTQLVPADDVHS